MKISAVDPATHHVSDAERVAYAQGWAAACHHLAGVADEWAAENTRMAADSIVLDAQKLLDAKTEDEARLEAMSIGQDCIMHSAMAIWAERIANECRKSAEYQFSS